MYKYQVFNFATSITVFLLLFLKLKPSINFGDHCFASFLNNHWNKQ